MATRRKLKTLVELYCHESEATALESRHHVTVLCCGVPRLASLVLVMTDVRTWSISTSCSLAHIVSHVLVGVNSFQRRHHSLAVLHQSFNHHFFLSSKLRLNFNILTLMTVV